MTLSLLLLLTAVILFAVAALNIETGRVNLIALGLAFFAGSFLVGTL